MTVTHTVSLVVGTQPDSLQQSVQVGHADDMHHQTAYLVKYVCTFISTLSLNDYSRHAHETYCNLNE